MNHDELLAFLREHMSIEVDISSIPWEHGRRVTVKLLLDGEEISRSHDDLPEGSL